MNRFISIITVMKTASIMFIGISAVVLALVIGFAIARPVLARVATTSTEASAVSISPVDTIASSTPTNASSTQPVANVSTSTTPVQTAPADTTSTTVGNSNGIAVDTAVTPTEPPPAGFAAVHIIGTRYIDYFTDGSTTVAVPGDPNIDSNLDKPDGLIPTHAGMTWVHSTGQHLYDAPSGDLEVGDYAAEPNGSYVHNAPPFVSSTSTLAQLSATTTGNTAAGTSSSISGVVSLAVSDTSTSTATTPSDSSASATTSSEPVPPTPRALNNWRN